MRDYYAVLGIEVAATPAQLRRAYRQLARRYSPDVNLWDREARGLFEEITQAYRVLSDPAARRLYDRQADPAGPATGGRAPERSGGRRGDDLHAPVDLSFEQAVAGATVELRIERLSPCETCQATGARPGAAAITCTHCGGSGMVWSGDAGRAAAGRCPGCDGSGEQVAEPCATCRGRGVRPAPAVIRVGLPPGMDTGGQVRVEREGHAGPFGGPRGDLIVITRVQNDPVFTRKGHNLYRDLSLTVVEAVLGARVRLPALGGVVDLVLPPGTQRGQVFRLRGKGMPRLDGEGRGDLYVAARVEIPRGIDARTQELFRELGRLLPEPVREATPGAEQA